MIQNVTRLDKSLQNFTSNNQKKNQLIQNKKRLSIGIIEKRKTFDFVSNLCVTLISAKFK